MPMSAAYLDVSSSASLAARRCRLRAGGDGASRPGVDAVPTIALPEPSAEARAAAAWRSRVEACHAEARAALRIPFNPPVTWEP